MKVLIVDDEPLAVRRLQRLLSHLGDYEVMTAHNGEQALVQVAKHHPQLVLMDIEMPVMDGMQAARQISDKYPQTAIIFLTAHEQFALPAFEVKAVDYLLKPVATTRLQRALDRVSDKQQERLTIKEGSRLLSVPVNEVICLQAEDKYVTAYLSDCHYLLDQSLTELAQSYRQFIRIHRSWLINVHFLRGITSEEPHLSKALLKNTEIQPPISRRQLSEVKKYLQI